MASSTNNFMTTLLDANQIAGYGYPTTCAVQEERFTSQDGTVSFVRHLIFAESAPGSSYNNAPNGSHFFNMTSADPEAYIKTAASPWTIYGSHT